MNVNGKEVGEMKTLNVVSLFDNVPSPELLSNDPLNNLILEAQFKGDVLISFSTRPVRVVDESHFPEQSLYILEEQLTQLKRSLERVKFYMGELDDFVPR